MLDEIENDLTKNKKVKESQYRFYKMVSDDRGKAYEVPLWYHLNWAIVVVVSVIIGWNMYHHQLQIEYGFEKNAEQKYLVTKFKKIKPEKKNWNHSFKH